MIVLVVNTKDDICTTRTLFLETQTPTQEHSGGYKNQLHQIAALKLFYQIMALRGTYVFFNPLVEPLSATVAAVEVRLGNDERKGAIPRMPEQSGVVAPEKRPRHRLSDSYFKLEHEVWKPQIVDDPKLPGLILEGGRQLALKQTRQRDEVVTWLLFETGARVSEICGLMLADWTVLGTQNKAKAFSKGSLGRRTKTISFAADTVILLRRYFDEERIHFDPNGYRLEEYLLLAKQKHLDLATIPLFLTSQGTQLTPKEYREHYWNPACAVADIEADVHQARHWLVTRTVCDIYETAQSTVEIERRLRGFIEYMKWKSEETLAAYQHYFHEQLDADTRDAFHQHLHEEAQQYVAERKTGKRRDPTSRRKDGKYLSAPQPELLHLEGEPDLAFLYGLAGEV